MRCKYEPFWQVKIKYKGEVCDETRVSRGLTGCTHVSGEKFNAIAVERSNVTHYFKCFKI